MLFRRVAVIAFALVVVRVLFYFSDNDLVESPIASLHPTLTDRGGPTPHERRALVLYHFHPCQRNATVNIGVFFANIIGTIPASVFVKGVHYIFVYGSKLEQKVTEVHRFRNCRVFRTPLLHADLVGFSAVAKKLWDAERWSERYSRIIWLNAGTIGPLVSSRDWVDIVSGGALPNASLLDADRTVIASTISWEVGVHPQSNFLSCPVAAADLLLRGLYSAPHRDKRDLIAKAEVGAGALLLKSNFLLFELTRRVFVNFDTPPLNRRNTYLEIVPNISNAVFYKHNDQGYKAMSAVVKQEAARLRAELRLDERRVSLLMARSLGFPDRSSPLRTYCTS